MLKKKPVVHKYYEELHQTVILRSNSHYGVNAVYARLLEAARQDFPTLKEEQVSLKRYNASHSVANRSLGIEFIASPGFVPETYKRTKNLPRTLSV